MMRCKRKTMDHGGLIFWKKFCVLHLWRTVGIVFFVVVLVCFGGGGGGAQGQLHCSFFHTLETGRVPYFYMYDALACSQTEIFSGSDFLTHTIVFFS